MNRTRADGLPPLRVAQAGVVAEFDFDRGLGTIRAAEGVVYPFHCSAIADGSRMIAVGTEVRYFLAAGRDGRIEARDIGPLVRMTP